MALLGLGADVNAVDAAGRTPLHVAQSPAVAIQLLANDADPQMVDKEGLTPAQYKSSARNLERFGFDGSHAAMLRLNDIGTARIVSDWLQAAHTLPAVQALAWASARHQRLALHPEHRSLSPAARLPAHLHRRVGRELTDMEISAPVLSRFVWARFKEWLQMRTETQHAREARQTAQLLARLWKGARDDGEESEQAVRAAIADELSRCAGLAGMLAVRESAAAGGGGGGEGAAPAVAEAVAAEDDVDSESVPLN